MLSVKLSLYPHHGTHHSVYIIAMDSYFNGIWKDTNYEYLEHSGYSLVDYVNDQKPSSVLDVGCGHNPFKGAIKNLVAIDPAFPQADINTTIEDFESDRKFDVAFCLGSINFGSEDLISKQVENLVLHMKEKSTIFWRLNPGNADHFGKLKDVYVRSPKLYETDSLRQLGKDLNESRKKLRKQGLLAMPNFYPWTVAKSFEFANKYNYNVTEVMPDGARLYVKWER